MYYFWIFFFQSYIALQHFNDALKDLNIAAKSSSSKRLFFIRGIVHLLLEVRTIYGAYENFKNLHVCPFFLFMYTLLVPYSFIYQMHLEFFFLITVSIPEKNIL